MNNKFREREINSVMQKWGVQKRCKVWKWIHLKPFVLLYGLNYDYKK